ncbi:MAG: site-specific DNA-methyltransferase [Lachnospiraceae bacterium]|jgi:adenine-specific DNA-methyltransferase|nr:site-specific DNA-methyltransferase [Lachnospiraceae bacterium]
MDKLKMHTPSLADENFATLAKLFPNAVTEIMDENGAVIRAIDKDVLTQEINTHVVEGREERYQFTWPDKRKSVLLANAPIAAALRPCREESVDFDTTENLYIEGDNLDVLKLLRETYLNRVKMIYIDPPYNTGNDFVYEDDFSEDVGEFLRRDGQYDEQGNRLSPNLNSNGRFHTDWLNMMYPRLRIARDLLTDGGVIFISIDDGEQANLRKLCSEVFGDENFVANIMWQKRTSPDARLNLGPAHDFIVVYAKRLDQLKDTLNKLELSEDRSNQYKNPDNDPRGPWASVDITGQTGHATPSQFYEITTRSGVKMKPPSGRCWAMAERTFNELVADGRIWFGESGSSRPRKKLFLSESAGINAWTWWTNTEVGHNQEASKEVKDLLGQGDIFTNPKPTRLLKRILELATHKTAEHIILDFFSGSATTAHAVMQLNAEDGGKRKFIMVQLPEVCDEKSEAAKAGYATIPEIGKERIRRAGQKIKDEAGLTAQDLDIGFRVLKLDSSNMKDVYYTPEELAQMSFSLDGFTDNIKADRTAEDLLFQVMLELGIPLSAKITQEGSLLCVNKNYLIACFDRVDTALITDIAKKKPYYAVFRDSSFANDSAMVNFEQVFNTYSPGTIRRVI